LSLRNEVGLGELVSPLNGYVTLKSALRGEVVQEGLRFYRNRPERRVGYGVHRGKRLGQGQAWQKALVYTDSFPGKKYNGEYLLFLSNEFTPKYIQTKKERVNTVYA